MLVNVATPATAFTVNGAPVIVPVLFKVTTPVKLTSLLPQASVAVTTTLGIATVTPVEEGWVVKLKDVATTWIKLTVLSGVDATGAPVFFPDPVAKKVIFACVIEKSKSLPSTAVAPNGQVNDNRIVNVFEPLSGATTDIPEKTILFAFIVPLATNVDPSNKATDCIACVQFEILFAPPCVIVNAVKVVGKPSASEDAPPSRIVNDHTWTPSVTVEIVAVFIVLEIVAGDEPATATISEFWVGFIVIVTIPDVALVPITLVAEKLIINVPVAVGVPVIAPVEVFKVKPVGKAPLVMA